MYLTRLGAAPFSGEETRRAQIAREMGLWNDWIVPRQQGEPFLSRPPLQNWAIALVAQFRGKLDETSTRLPSALGVLVTVMLIYGYGRTFLSRLGATTAAAAFATMGQVLQLGRLGETESFYTLLVAGSLLAWRWADAARRSPLRPWCLGYALAALGMLTKGPQAPAYFVAGVGAFLILSGRSRELLRWPNAAGMALFLAIWGAWQVPFWLRTSTADSWDLLAGEITNRLDAGPAALLKHLVTYPVEVLVCTLPWSVLLVAYLRRDFRRTLADAAVEVRFLACTLAVTFPTCWFMPAARGRYFVPLYPCLALLIGLVAQRCCQAAAAPWARLWRWYRRSFGLAMPAVGAWVLAATALGWSLALGAQSIGLAALFAVTATLLGILVFRSAGSGRPLGNRVAALGVAVFLGLVFTGLVGNVQIARGRPLAQQIAAVRQRLPKDAQLVSIGAADPTFAFFYGAPIRQLPAEPAKLEKETGWTYFCLDCGDPDLKCEFPYEELAVAHCNSTASPQASGRVIIGRRLWPEQDLPEISTARRPDAPATLRR